MPDLAQLRSDPRSPPSVASRARNRRAATPTPPNPNVCGAHSAAVFGTPKTVRSRPPGGAERLTVLSPFHDADGKAVRALAQELGTTSVTISLLHWATIVERHSNLVPRNLVRHLLETCVLSQHFAVASGRFDGVVQRLRVTIDDEGLEFLANAPWRPIVTADRLGSTLSLNGGLRAAFARGRRVFEGRHLAPAASEFLRAIEEPESPSSSATLHREPQRDCYLLEPIDALADERISVMVMVNVERAG